MPAKPSSNYPKVSSTCPGLTLSTHLSARDIHSASQTGSLILGSGLTLKQVQLVGSPGAAHTLPSDYKLTGLREEVSHPRCI